MDYGAKSSKAAGYTFSKPVHAVMKGHGKDKKFGTIQFTVKKGGKTSKMVFGLGGKLKDNFMSVDAFTGSLKVAKVPGKNAGFCKYFTKNGKNQPSKMCVLKHNALDIRHNLIIFNLSQGLQERVLS